MGDFYGGVRGRGFGGLLVEILRVISKFYRWGLSPCLYLWSGHKFRSQSVF